MQVLPLSNQCFSWCFVDWWFGYLSLPILFKRIPSLSRGLLTLPQPPKLHIQQRKIALQWTCSWIISLKTSPNISIWLSCVCVIIMHSSSGFVPKLYQKHTFTHLTADIFLKKPIWSDLSIQLLFNIEERYVNIFKYQTSVKILSFGSILRAGPPQKKVQDLSIP